MSMDVTVRNKPVRSDTFDLRDQMQSDSSLRQLNAAHADAGAGGGLHYQQQQQLHQDDLLEGEHSVLEDDSDEGDLHDDEDDYIDDGSSSLSIPNESIDFDLVYSLHSFAATVEGQANVVKGDSLILMDDTNSYWWLVRVLKTQEVGYIPAENIETPFERLARLNKHRNIDLASPTQQEVVEADAREKERLKNAPPTFSRIGGLGRATPSPLPAGRPGVFKDTKGVSFTPEQHVHRYPPFFWGNDGTEWDEEEDDDDWDVDPYVQEDEELAEDLRREEALKSRGLPMKVDPSGPFRGPMQGIPVSMEPDDGMAWDESAARQQQAAQMAERQQQLQLQQQQQQQQASPQAVSPQSLQGIPAALQPGPGINNPYLHQQQQLRQPQQDLQALQASEQQQRSRLDYDPAAAQDPSLRRQIIDPFEQGETLKLSPTPNIVREAEADSSLRGQQQDTLQRQQSDRKRKMEEEVEAQKRARLNGVGNGGQPITAAPVSSSQSPSPQAQQLQAQQQQLQLQGVHGKSQGGKLRKEHSSGSVGSKASSASGDSTDEEGSKKKKGSSFMGSLFGRGKKKDKDRVSSIGSSAEGGLEGRGSPENVKAGGSVEGLVSPTTGLALQQQQQMTTVQLQPQQMNGQNLGVNPRNSTDPKRVLSMQQQQQQPSPPQSVTPSLTDLGQGNSLAQPSEHTTQLRQRDRDQQALYQQYLNRSPSSAPEPSLSYGLQSASAVGKQYSHVSSPSSGSFTGLGPPPDSKRQRPGSLILTPSSPDGVSAVPELSVIRVFAGSNLQTDATFKTVLLNSSTTAGELVKQSIQRFRLPQAELDDAALSSYYLLAKQVEGGASIALKPDEKPLSVFEEMNKRALEDDEMSIPKIKRASVSSLSSLASNLSAHPAIEKLPMNDFTDDSAVKFYLNRRGSLDDREEEESWRRSDVGNESTGGEGDDTLIAISSHDGHDEHPNKKYLSVNTSSANANSNAGSERFNSPSFRFPLQLVIYPDDLPDNMAFDPITEAIVFKDTLRERGDASSRTNSGVSLDMRRKVFVFPKNVTVAEVIEIGLERFGILEGVVDGGDEVEDKSSKRKSMSRVRYNLCADIDGSERELAPTSKIIDAYPHPPTYKAVDRKFQDNKRRSVDSAMLLGSVDDVGDGDPMFVLRRAATYRNISARGALSKGPLDELALSHLKRNSMLSSVDPNAGSVPVDSADSKNKILAQRKARSENQQRAILGAQTNSVRGVDLLLPGNVVVRSSRATTEQPRYSVVEADGEEYDISPLVEEELKKGGNLNTDFLQGMLGESGDGMARLDRVLSKLKAGQKSPLREIEENEDRAATPQQQTFRNDDRRPGSRSNTSTPTARTTGVGPRRQPSDLSEVSVYATPTSQMRSPLEDLEFKQPSSSSEKKLYLPKDDFGISDMLAVIECRAMRPTSRLPRIDHVDSLLFGRPLDSVHLHPDVMAIYSDGFKQLEECNTMLDQYMQKSLTTR